MSSFMPNIRDRLNKAIRPGLLGCSAETIDALEGLLGPVCENMAMDDVTVQEFGSALITLGLLYRASGGDAADTEDDGLETDGIVDEAERLIKAVWNLDPA